MSPGDTGVLAAELPWPGILDEYEAIVPGARERLLEMRRRLGDWESVGRALRSAMKAEGPVQDWPRDRLH